LDLDVSKHNIDFLIVKTKVKDGYFQVQLSINETLDLYKHGFPSNHIWIENICNDSIELGSENPEHDCVRLALIFYVQDEDLSRIKNILEKPNLENKLC